MTAKFKQIDQENVRYDKSAVETNKQMIQVMGYSKYCRSNVN